MIINEGIYSTLLLIRLFFIFIIQTGPKTGPLSFNRQVFIKIKVCSLQHHHSINTTFLSVVRLYLRNTVLSMSMCMQNNQILIHLPPCLAAEVKCSSWGTVRGFHQTWHCALLPNVYICILSVS